MATSPATQIATSLPRSDRRRLGNVAATPAPRRLGDMRSGRSGRRPPATQRRPVLGTGRPRGTSRRRLLSRLILPQQEVARNDHDPTISRRVETCRRAAFIVRLRDPLAASELTLLRSPMRPVVRLIRPFASYTDGGAVLPAGSRVRT